MPWTRFMDLYVRGKSKTPYNFVFIEASKEMAILLFKKTFGLDPVQKAEDGWGPLYAIETHPTFERASAYDRGCLMVYFLDDMGDFAEAQNPDRLDKPYTAKDAFKNNPGVKVISIEDYLLK